MRPWGVQVTASESGTGTDSNTVFVGLPVGRTYDNPEMLIVLSPTLERMLIELALGDAAYPRHDVLSSRIWESCDTTADRAAELLAATAALQYLRTARATAAPEAARLTQRIQGLVAGLIAAQNRDGGWSWVSGRHSPQTAENEATSDSLTSSAVIWALTTAEPLGLVSDVKVLDQGVAYLQQAFARSSGNDRETRVALLHALSTQPRGGF